MKSPAPLLVFVVASTMGWLVANYFDLSRSYAYGVGFLAASVAWFIALQLKL